MSVLSPSALRQVAQKLGAARTAFDGRSPASSIAGSNSGNWAKHISANTPTPVVTAGQPPSPAAATAPAVPGRAAVNAVTPTPPPLR